MNAPSGLIRAACEAEPDPWADLTGFDVPTYSKSQIVKAGKLVAGWPPYPVSEETLQAFRTVHEWRTSHIVPMRRVRFELSKHAKAFDRQAITVGRQKRMQSIRRKLRRGNITLYQMQDIAGCRAIMSSVAEMASLVAMYRGGGSKYAVFKEDDYVVAPKRGGYRGHHIILKYTETGGSKASDNNFVEVQVRTQLQHAWATAVEAVGLVRSEELKSGVGNADWLRLFEVISSEFALEEGGALVPGAAEKREDRLVELRQLEKRLDAVKTLTSYKQAIAYSENFAAGSSGDSLLIQYDNDARTVTVSRYRGFPQTSETYYAEEGSHKSRNTVLVQVDRVEDLRAAYPNYFLDVSIFADRLSRLVHEQHPRAPKVKRDLAWLANWALHG